MTQSIQSSILESLCPLLCHSAAIVKSHAVQTLLLVAVSMDQAAKDRILTALLPLLSDDSPDARWHAVFALCKLSQSFVPSPSIKQQVVERLLPVLEDKCRDHRIAAIQALTALGAAEHLSKFAVADKFAAVVEGNRVRVTESLCALWLANIDDQQEKRVVDRLMGMVDKTFIPRNITAVCHAIRRPVLLETMTRFFPTQFALYVWQEKLCLSLFPFGRDGVSLAELVVYEIPQPLVITLSIAQCDALQQAFHTSRNQLRFPTAQEGLRVSGTTDHLIGACGCITAGGC